MCECIFSPLCYGVTDEECSVCEHYAVCDYNERIGVFDYEEWFDEWQTYISEYGD